MKKRIKLLVAIIGCGCVLATAENGIQGEITAYAQESEHIAVTSIALNKTSMDFTTKGEVGQLSVTFTPSGAINKNIIWSSSNPSVAVVDDYGTVTSVGEGQTVITAKSEENQELYKSCVVNCEWTKVKTIKLNKSTASITEIGGQVQLTATVTPTDAVNRTVEWSTSDSNVATVNTDGTVTARGEGNAVIYCKSTDGSEIVASCSLSVSLPRIEKIKLNTTKVTVTEIDKATALTATITPTNAVDKNVIWTTSDPNVALVSSDGIVSTGRVDGTAIITCTSASNPKISASCTVNVKIPIEQITLSKNEVKVTTGKEFNLNAVSYPHGFTDTGIVWTSSNTSIASVNDYGVVKTHKPGSVTIKATSKDYSKVYATCNVNVSPKQVTGLTVKKNKDGSRTLKWNAVSGVSGYKIYQLKNNVWKKIADTHVSSFQLKNIKTGNCYQYRVMAYYTVKDSKGNVTKTLNGKKSNVYGYVYASTATKCSVTKNKPTSVSVRWNAVNCDGYRVVLYKGNKAVRTFRTTKTSYTFTKLQKETGYRVEVKPYTKNEVTNKLVYGKRASIRFTTVK